MAQPKPPEYPDAYADLGLPPTATSGEIKTAYHKLALLHHPDKNLSEAGSAADAADFRRTNEAYKILNDSETKTRYDRQYSEVLKDWSRYRADVADFTQNPEAWSKKHADSIRSQPDARARSREQYHGYYTPYEDDEEYYGYSYGEEYSGASFFDYFFGFFSRHGGARPHPERPGDQERKTREKKESDQRFKEYMKANREKMLKGAAQRALELQRREAKAAQSKGDGICTYSQEEKLAMAKTWIKGIQNRYAKELREIEATDILEEVQLNMGWEKKKKGRHKCDFCDAVVPGYSYRCPSGGAMACRPCKNAIESSSLTRPFDFVKTHAGSKKAKGQKKASDSDKNTDTFPDAKSEEVAPVDPEEDADYGKEAKKLAAKLAAKEKEAQRLGKQSREREARKVRQAEQREAREKTTRLVAEEAGRKEAEAKTAALEKVAADEAARKAADLAKEIRSKEVQHQKSAKKAARKKAAKEKAKEQVAKEQEAKNQVAKEQEAKNQANQEQANKEKTTEQQAANMQRESLEKAKKDGEAHEDEAKKRETQAAKEKASREAQQTASRQQDTQVPPKPNASDTKLCYFTCNAEGHVARECSTKPANTAPLINGTNAAANDKTPLQINGATASTNGEDTSPTINGEKRAKTKATRCYTCNEAGHVKRDCPVKAGKGKGQGA